jgi:hypothetical protein
MYETPKTSHGLNQGFFTTSLVGAAGYAVWEWTAVESSWSMLEDRSGPEHEPGEGPIHVGRFEARSSGGQANQSGKPNLDDSARTRGTHSNGERR